ncbi:MAG: BatA domain-containing protein [Planctomycetes bacterium]|nr:BatA domain-containing protein [Planctomycetota bacterium]
MEFLNVPVLAGMLAGILPVIIHLIHRERPKVIPFTALQFIRQSAKGSSRGIRLKHLLLLLFRVFLVLLFALILARPVVRHASFLASNSEVTRAVIILDDSYLMGVRDSDGLPHFQRAQRLASDLVRSFPPGSAVALFLSSQQPFDFSIDLASVISALELAQPTTRLPSCTRAISRAYEMLGRRGVGLKEIFVFSNLCVGAWMPMTVPPPHNAEQVRLVLVDVAEARGENLAILSARPSSSLVDRNSPVRIDGEVYNSGPTRSCGLDLFVQGQKRASRQVEIPGGKTVTVSFPYEFTEAELAQGSIRLTREDALAVDNERFFTVQVVGPVQAIAVVRPGGDSDAFFTLNALSPSGLRGRERVQIVVTEAGHLTAAPLQDVDVVLVLNGPRLDAREWDQLWRFVDRGGGLGIAFGPSTDPEHYSNLTHLPLRLLGVKEGLETHLALRPEPHPFLDRFRGESLSSISLARFHQFVEVAAPQPGDPLRVLASFSGLPALIEGGIGRGRILVFTSALTTEWSDLPKWPVFPPFLHEFVNYLAGRQVAVTSYHPGEPIPIPVRPDELEAAVNVFEPGSERPVALFVSPSTASALHTAGPALGNAQVFLVSASRTRKLGYSVNLESDAERYHPLGLDVLRKLIPQAEGLTAQDDLTREAAESARGSEITAPLLVLLMLLFCVESFLANRIYR